MKGRSYLENYETEFKGDLPKNLHVGDRVIHDERQVRSVDDLVEGAVYIAVHNCEKVDDDRDDLSQRLTFTFRGLLGCGQKIKVDWSHRTSDDLVFLADFGVIPYGTGLWNPGNYLLPVNADVSRERS